MKYPVEQLLKEINTQGSVYDIFRPEAMLTANQLNKITNYFEDSDRQRTIDLHGVGIVCGFQYKYQVSNGSLEKITITPGEAVTTDGDKLPTDLKELTHFKQFANHSQYQRLMPVTNGGVIEIVDEGAAGSLSGELPSAPFIGSFRNYHLVVFLDHYGIDPGLCGATSCDDTGDHIQMDMKYLLVHKDFWNDTLMPDDTIFHEHNVWIFYDSLRDFSVDRAVLKSGNCKTISQVYNLFKSNINQWKT